MPKLTDMEIRQRMLNDKAIKARDAMPERPFKYVNKTLSRTNAVLARRATFKQAV